MSLFLLVSLLSWAGLIMAAVPALLTFANLRLFRGPPDEPPVVMPRQAVWVLVPARN